jgi:hypothetical protein
MTFSVTISKTEVINLNDPKEIGDNFAISHERRPKVTHNEYE